MRDRASSNQEKGLVKERCVISIKQDISKNCTRILEMTALSIRWKRRSLDPACGIVDILEFKSLFNGNDGVIKGVTQPFFKGLGLGVFNGKDTAAWSETVTTSKHNLRNLKAGVFEKKLSVRALLSKIS